MSLSLQATGRDKHANNPAKMVRWVSQVLDPAFPKYCSKHAWSPAINLYEDDQGFHMVVDLAGMKAEHMDLRVENGILIISGQRDAPLPEKTSGNTTLHLMEIDHGTFSRSLELPASVDLDSFHFSYKCGFLWIRMNKKDLK